MQSILMRGAAASALALILAAGASAQQEPNGYLAVGVSTTNLDVGGTDDDVTGYTFGGGYYNALGGIDLQLTASYDYLDTEPDEVDGVGAELSLFGRNEMRAVGVFGSVVDSEDSTSLGGGGELQLYNNNWTLGGSAAWFDGDDAFDSLFGGCGFGRVYASDNLAFEGRAMAGNIDYGPADTTAYGFGAGAELQLMGSPFSFAGDVDYATLDDFDVDATSFMLTGRLHFGTTDLVSRDRGGAGMRGGSCISGVSNL